MLMGKIYLVYGIGATLAALVSFFLDPVFVDMFEDMVDISCAFGVSAPLLRVILEESLVVQ